MLRPPIVKISLSCSLSLSEVCWKSALACPLNDARTHIVVLHITMIVCLPFSPRFAQLILLEAADLRSTSHSDIATSLELIINLLRNQQQLDSFLSELE